MYNQPTVSDFFFQQKRLLTQVLYCEDIAMQIRQWVVAFKATKMLKMTQKWLQITLKSIKTSHSQNDVASHTSVRLEPKKLSAK